MEVDDKVRGEFQYSGVQPYCLPRLAELGIDFDVSTLAAMPSAAGVW